MDFVVTGQVTQVLQPQQGVSQRTQQPWQSQEFVLTYEQGQYPRSLCFRVFGADKLAQFAIQQGETITAHLNITCQKTQQGRFFNSIDCWNVERQPMQAAAPAPYQQQQVIYQQQAPAAYQQPAPAPAPAPAPFPPQQAPIAPPPQPTGTPQQLPF